MQELIDRTARDNYPPLHNIFLFAVTHTFGDSEFWLRLPSVVFGTLTIPAVYWVGCKLYSRRAGLFAAAILSLAAFHVDYSQGRQWRYWEDRGYECTPASERFRCRAPWLG